jgi:hypothetical protein
LIKGSRLFITGGFLFWVIWVVLNFKFMTERVKLKYQSTRKKGASSKEIMADIRLIARHHGVYAKEADVYSDYFEDCINRVRSQNYYYAMRMEQLAYRHERAKRKEQALRKAA